MKKAIFLICLLSFFKVDSYAEWKAVVHVDKESKDRDKIIYMLTHYESNIKRAYTGISVGSTERPIPTYYALKVFDVVWNNERDCHFGEDQKKPRYKNLEYSAVAYLFPSGKTGGMIFGEESNWERLISPCQDPDIETFLKPKLRRWIR
ncbi:MAG: hypothetical protein DRQ88_00755 [Epsilonproteobacteria bacterium]|nr:MAG: hypothetical protein DRQ89_10290 [Campylobacterota bacterium]RLA68164.1 MAG: hypothetical protein DRQ88_00755 [Campylobacterota bacterium]